MSRFYESAKLLNADVVVRITGDCPLVDSSLVDQCIQRYKQSQVDYFSNIDPTTYPDGLDIEVMSFASIERAYNEANLEFDREHVTPYIYRNPKEFKIGSVELDVNYSHHRWTVDYAEDFDLIKKIIEEIYPLKTDFDMNDTLDYLKAHPELNNINSGIIKEQILV